MKKAAALLFLLFASCISVPPATPESRGVTVTSNNQLTVGCKLLGSIEAADQWKVGDSRVELSNKAAAMGGNLVLLTRKIEVMQEAEVYACENVPAARKSDPEI